MKKRFNYKKFILFCICVISIIFLIIFGIVKLVKDANYKKSYEYKVTLVGYTLEEYKTISDKLTNKEIDELLKLDYDKNIIEFIKEDYFIFDNLDRYLEYLSKHKKVSNDKIVSIVNTNNDKDWLDLELETDTSKKNLMLVNRFYGLSETYEPELVKLTLDYSYDYKSVSKEIESDLINLIDTAKESGYTFLVSSGYRSYEEQKELYDSYVEAYGQSETDDLVARPGHSEYQTGLSIELRPYNKVFEDDYESEEYKYLKENAYKYGFILRFDKGTSSLTGFDDNAWRLRYVGVDVATKIYELGITFDEYYMYFIDNKKE